MENLTETFSKEEIILNAVKYVLTTVIKDTAVAPGYPHPLSISTRNEIRQCLVLITEREQELALSAGRPIKQRPHFKDEPHKTKETFVPISSIKTISRNVDEHDSQESPNE